MNTTLLSNPKHASEQSGVNETVDDSTWHVFVDMDGVLVDFIGGLKSIFFEHRHREAIENWPVGSGNYRASYGCLMRRSGWPSIVKLRSTVGGVG